MSKPETTATYRYRVEYTPGRPQIVIPVSIWDDSTGESRLICRLMNASQLEISAVCEALERLRQ